ncbi:MAG: ferredoxin [Nocardioides sp.]|uniref:ferredoxin n=1 Tax=Nocardioides sp. TaxID=35761 RepID=UPI0039E6769C
MKALIDMTKCSGHARCFDIDSDLFQIDDSGYALREEFDVPSDREAAARDGAAACPERAITLR